MDVSGLVADFTTLDWHNTDDYIHVTNYGGVVNIATDKVFTDDNNVYMGYDVNIPGGVTLTPACIISLPDNVAATGNSIIRQEGTTAYARPGDPVTLESTREGYTLGSVTITPATAVTAVGDGTFSFTMPATNVTVEASFKEIIPYIDADGNTAYCINYTVLTGSENTLTAGAWYVVKESINSTAYDPITISGGAANIILCDGKTFDLDCSSDGYINGSLNIYGQSEGTGAFNYDNNADVSYATRTCLINGNLTIYGGQVTLVGRNQGNGPFPQSAVNGDVTIWRGLLYAKGGDNSEDYGANAITDNVYFYGGSLTAVGGSGREDAFDGIGIIGSVVLSWSSLFDRFYASSYYNAVDIVSGKGFTDGTDAFFGTLDDAQIDNLAGKTLQPVTDYALDGTWTAGRWYALASPMMDGDLGTLTIADSTNLTANGSYDLYRYNETTATWENYKAHGDFTALQPGQGYIYRHSGNEDVTLHSKRNLGHEAGEGNFHGENCTVTLTYSGTSGDLAGFNLIGNPFPLAIPCARPYYSMNPDGSWTAHLGGGTLAIGQAVLVHTTTDGEQLTITPSGIAAGGAKSLPPLPGGFNLSDQSDLSDLSDQSDQRHFAYQQGDQLVITQPGHLEAYDALGRLIFTRDLNSQFSIPQRRCLPPPP